MKLGCVFLLVVSAVSTGRSAELVQADDLTAYDALTGRFVDRTRWHAPRPTSAATTATDSVGRSGASDAYVACSTTDDAYPFDLTSYAVGSVVTILPEANYPYDATMSPDGSEVWIPGASGDGVVVIERASNSVTHRISVGEYPISVAFTGDAAYALVSSRDFDRIDRIDTTSYSVLDSLAMPAHVGNMARDPVSGLIYAVEWYGDQLYEISADGSTLLNAVSLGTSLWQVVVDPAGVYVYVTDRGPDQIRVIERATLTETRVIDVALDPWGLDVTRDGTTLVVACEDAAQVDIIDTVSWAVTAIPLEVGAEPRDVDILDSAGLAFVVGGDPGTNPVYVIDLPTATIVDNIDFPCSNTNVIAVQPLDGGASCAGAPDPVTGLTAVKSGPDVSLVWAGGFPPVDAHNVWRVDVKDNIPLASDPPPVGVSGVCVGGPGLSCVDDDGISSVASSRFYYQVKAVCAGIEGP